MNHKRNIRIGLAIAATTIAAAFAPAGAAADVCNEARENHPGFHNATDPDPDPPARYQLGLEPIGDNHGLDNAASHSPALSRCSPLVIEV